MTSERHGSEEKTVAEKALSLSPSHSFVPRRTFGGYFFCLTKAPYALLLFVTLVLQRAKVAMRIYAPRRRTNAFYVCTIVSWREGSGRERRGRRDDGKPPEERVRLGGGEGGKSRRRCTMWQVCERTREREIERERKEGTESQRVIWLGQRVSTFPHGSAARPRRDHLSQGCDLPTLPPSRFPALQLVVGAPRARTDGGGHNGLHILSHRDDTRCGARSRARTWTFKRDRG